MYVAKTNHDRVTAMTHRRLLPCRRRTDQQQEAADIAGTGEPHDPTNGDSVNQDGENEYHGPRPACSIWVKMTKMAR